MTAEIPLLHFSRLFRVYLPQVCSRPLSHVFLYTSFSSQGYIRGGFSFRDLLLNSLFRRLASAAFERRILAGPTSGGCGRYARSLITALPSVRFGYFFFSPEMAAVIVGFFSRYAALSCFRSGSARPWSSMEPSTAGAGP